jgi:hypothetical protein
VESDSEDTDDQDGSGDGAGEGEVEAPLRSLNGRERKRRKDVSFELGDSSKKRARHDYDEGPDFVSPLRWPLYCGFTVKHIGSQGYHRPNPTNFARSDWVPKAYLESDTDSNSENDSLRGPDRDDTRPLTTTLDSLEPQNWRKSFYRGTIIADDEDIKSPVGALTSKPSPGEYAKRRWSSAFWASHTAHGSFPNHSEQSDAEDSSPEHSEANGDNDSIDMDINYQKRYSVYFITQEDADTSNLDSWEGVRFYYIHSFRC